LTFKIDESIKEEIINKVAKDVVLVCSYARHEKRSYVVA